MADLNLLCFATLVIVCNRSLAFAEGYSCVSTKDKYVGHCAIHVLQMVHLILLVTHVLAPHVSTYCVGICQRIFDVFCVQTIILIRWQQHLMQQRGVLLNTTYSNGHYVLGGEKNLLLNEGNVLGRILQDDFFLNSVSEL